MAFLAGNGHHVKGCGGFSQGTEEGGKRISVADEHQKILISQGCIVRKIEPVYSRENQTQFAMAYYVINYSKLRIWEVMFFSFHNLISI